MKFLTIKNDGTVNGEAELSSLAHDVCKATADMYKGAGFLPPWTGYLYQKEDQIMGTCAFKSPPHGNRVEIAYFTFPEYQNRGIATEMVKKLISIAKENMPGVIVSAQTLPLDNASTAILSKLGFLKRGTIHNSEDGDVWEWELL